MGRHVCPAHPSSLLDIMDYCQTPGQRQHWQSVPSPSRERLGRSRRADLGTGHGKRPSFGGRTKNGTYEIALSAMQPSRTHDRPENPAFLKQSFTFALCDAIDARRPWLRQTGFIPRIRTFS